MSKIAQNSTARKRARDSVTPIAPATITQLNCEAVCGVTGRWFRERVPELGIRHTRIGKLLFVTVADFLEAIAQRAQEARSVEVANDDRVETADEILRGLGVRKVG